MELVLALAIGVLTASGVWLLFRPRTFQVIIGLCLIAYAVNYPDLYGRFARYADKIFKGAKPADLPVEQPARFELVINARTAKTLGLTLPQSLLLRADEVIR